MHPAILRAFALIVLLSSTFSPARAQDISLSGTIFSDYFYQISSPDEDVEGHNAFDFRRVRLTSDFVLSDRFTGRLRLEGKEDQTTQQGTPTVFIKDAYLRWNDAFGDGHRVTFGLLRPPIWWEAEDQWAYRSLEKTLMDRVGIAKSRDSGILVNGPISDKVAYAFMVGNNSGGKQETNDYKRVYGQLTFDLSDNIVVTTGADYFTFEDGSSINLNAFVGYSLERSRFGAEGFYSPTSFDEIDGDDVQFGFSVFANHDLTDSHRLVLRFDRNERDDFGVKSNTHWAAAGLAFLMDDNLQIIPNVIYEKNDSDDTASVMTRLTLWANF